MNKEIKAAWVAALRSGSYSRGTGYLRQRNDKGRLQYCCLGVLCNLGAQAKNKWYEDSDLFYYDDNESELPANVAKTAGISQDAESILIDMNDGSGDYAGKSCGFKKIAAWIDKNL